MVNYDGIEEMDHGPDKSDLPEFQSSEILHPTFKANIDEHFGSIYHVPESMLNFIENTNRGFWQSDAEKRLMERAYELSSGNLIIANEYLRIAHEGLEQKVIERTAELLRANDDLISEIEDRIKAEEALRQSEERHRSLAEKLRQLASELSLAEERERRRIASELHDSIVQTLVFSKFKIETIIKALLGTSLEGSLNEIHAHIKKSVQDLRTLIFDISPPVLYDFGLEPALETLALQIQQRHGIKLSFHDDESEKKLHNDLKVLLYHAVRELLVNMVKHAVANNGSIETRKEDKSIAIIVEDDGIGFAPSTVSCADDKKACFGLFNIRERLGHFGGRMQIDSAPGRGSRFILTAPLESNSTEP